MPPSTPISMVDLPLEYCSADHVHEQHRWRPPENRDWRNCPGIPFGWKQVIENVTRWFEHLRALGVTATAGGHKKTVHEAHEFAKDPSAEEAADVVISVLGYCHFRDWDLTEAIAKKMHTNWQREWRDNGDGTWRHVSKDGTMKRPAGEVLHEKIADIIDAAHGSSALRAKSMKQAGEIMALLEAEGHV